MTEKQLERRLVQGVRFLGGKAYKFLSPGNVGVPDRLVVLPGGVVLFAELKTTAGRLTPNQSMRISELQRLGADVHELRGVAGVDSFLVLCRRRKGDDF